jgi:hypothetical protein
LYEYTYVVLQDAFIVPADGMMQLWAERNVGYIHFIAQRVGVHRLSLSTSSSDSTFSLRIM